MMQTIQSQFVNVQKMLNFTKEVTKWQNQKRKI